MVDHARILNQRELVDLIEQPARNPELATELLQNVRPRDVQRSYVGELYRRLHNYLASTKTLVDHSRNLLRAYEGQEIQTAYDARTVSLMEMPVVRFVQDLRNVLLHQELPGISLNNSFTRRDDGAFDTTFEVRLLRDRLLENDRLTTLARKYVRDQNDDFPLGEPVADYGAAIDELHRWLTKQFQVLHSDELADYNALVLELQALLGFTEEGSA